MASVDNAGTLGVPDVVLTSQYDPAGNRSSLSATIGGTADFLNTYSYDTLSRLASMIQQGQNGGNTVADKEVDYGYDAIGDVTRRSAYNYIGVGPRYDIATETVSRNALGLVTNIAMTSHAGEVALDSLTYSYDTLARVSTFGSIDGTAAYGYDPTSQLTSATYTAAPGHTEPPNFSVAFDPNGNRTSANGTNTTVGPDNHVTSDGTFQYTFDSAGNLVLRQRYDTSPPTNDYKTVYDWDYRNRLTDVYFYDPSGTLTQRVHFVYDAWNHLIERELDPNGSGTFTVDAHYVWDASAPPTLGVAGQPPNAPGNIVLAFNGSQQLTTRYLVGPNLSAYDQFPTTLAEEDVNSSGQTGSLTFDLQDEQGSLTDIADDDGNLTDHLAYTAYGQVFNETNPSITHIAGYAGGLYDAATGLVYNIERWYDPLATVWLSADPTGFAGGDFNLSRYAGNDPGNVIDPLGTSNVGIGFDLPRREPPTIWDKLFPPVGPADFLCPLGGMVGAAGRLTGAMAKAQSAVRAGTKLAKAIPVGGKVVTVGMKCVDAVTKISLRGKSLTSGMKKLKAAGLTPRKGANGAWEFVDSCEQVRVRWIPRSGKEPPHWHRFGPRGSNAGSHLNNAGRPVTPTQKSHRVLSNGGSPKGGGGPGSPSPLGALTPPDGAEPNPLV